MFDSYNIRKIAPRMLLAVIGVNLSIYLCVAAVDITNVIGGGLASLIRGPFLDAGTFGSTGLDPGSGVGGKVATGAIVGLVGGGAGLAAGAGAGFLGTMLTGAVTLGGAVAPLILLVLLLLILAGVLIALAIMATVVIRYGAVILLTLVSPVAISMLVLPGTEKYFRKWWEYFTKTLVVYPIIAAIFAISDVMAAIFLKAQGQEGGGSITDLITIFVVIVVVYAPLFMIPFSFKLAGGFLGSAYDFANKNMYGRAKPRMDKWKEKEGGIYDKARKRSQKGREAAGLTGKQIGEGLMAAGGHLASKQNRQRARENRRRYPGEQKLFKEYDQFQQEYEQKRRNGTLTQADRNKMAALESRVHATGAYSGLQATRPGLIREAAGQYRKQSAAVGATYARIAAKEAREKDEDVKTLEGIDEAGQAGKKLVRGDESGASQALIAANRAQYDYKEAGVSDEVRATRKADHDRVMGALKRVNGRYRGQAAYMIHSLNDHGSAASSSSTDEMNQDALFMANGDTVEEARVLADLRAAAKEARRPDKSGLGISTDIKLMSEAKDRVASGENETAVWEDIKQRKLVASMDRSSASEIVTAHPKAVAAMQNTIIQRLRSARNEQEREVALAQSANMYDAFQYAAPDNISELDGLMDVMVDVPKDIPEIGTDGKPTGKSLGTKIERMTTLNALEHMRGKTSSYADFAKNRRDFRQEEGAARDGAQQTGGLGAGAK